MCGSDFPAARAVPRWAAAAALCLLAAGTAFAQQAASREQELLRRLRLQVQNLQAERAGHLQALQKAQGEAADAERQLAAARQESRQLKAGLDAQVRRQAEVQRSHDARQREADALQASIGSLQAELARARAELQASQAGFAQQRQALADAQTRLGQREGALLDLQSRHRTQAQGLQACLASNSALQALGQEVLQRYATQTVAQVLARDEPFVQSRRVALENLLQGYQDKLDALALAPAADAVRSP